MEKETRPVLAWLGEVITLAAVTAWVGGHAALGAFAARIAFRDLDRGVASTLMTTVFQSFDGLAVWALVALGLATVLRAAALGREAWRGFGFVSLATAAALLAVGVLGISWVHPRIEEMFRLGATLDPRFGALHRLSERLGHLEVLLAMLLFGSLAWRRRQV